jgi:hypothetical protein
MHSIFTNLPQSVTEYSNKILSPEFQNWMLGVNKTRADLFMEEKVIAPSARLIDGVCLFVFNARKYWRQFLISCRWSFRMNNVSSGDLDTAFYYLK